LGRSHSRIGDSRGGREIESRIGTVWGKNHLPNLKKNGEKVRILGESRPLYKKGRKETTRVGGGYESETHDLGRSKLKT